MAIIPLRTVARAPVYVAGAASDASAFRSARTTSKKEPSSVGNTGGQSCTGDIVIWARIPASRTTSGDCNQRGQERSMRGQEFTRNSRDRGDDRNAFRRGGIGDGEREREEKGKEKKRLTVATRDPPSPRREKKLNVALVREQNMAHVTSRGTIGIPAAMVQRARTSFACSIFLLDARPR